MNISRDGTTVSFKTEPQELFETEKSGAKPNLLCLMDFDEWTLLKQHNPTKIIVQHQQEIFLRTLTNIHLEGEMLNTWVVSFSWATEDAHTMSLDQLDSFVPGPHSVPFEQGDHSVRLQQEAETPAETCHNVEDPSIDEKFHAITISTQTLALLQDLAHGQSMDGAIRMLHEDYLNRKTSTWRPRHD